MSHKKVVFPQGFLWGASTSAYQCEGASNEDGKGRSVQDMKVIGPGLPDLTVCSDHYHRFREDIRLFAEMGLKAYRFSIAWTRILPKGFGMINQSGVDHYREVISECRKYNIEPVVTMYHFDLPEDLQKEGGWTNPKSIEWFVAYAKVLFEQFGDLVKYWITINEQNIMTLHPHAIGIENDENVYQANHHMFVAQAKVFELCHRACPDVKIGPAPNISLIYPKDNKPENIKAAQDFNSVRNWLYLDVAVYGRYNPQAVEIIKSQGYRLEISEEDLSILKKGKPDFLGINYYTTKSVEEYVMGEYGAALQKDQEKVDDVPGYYRGCKNTFLERTSFGWDVDPMGLRLTVNEVYCRYALPILITENGLGTGDILLENDLVEDDYRIAYLKNHIYQLGLAIEAGIDVFGYCPWSAIDLISTHQGFESGTVLFM